VSLSDAKKKLSEIIDQVGKAARKGITHRGKLAAVIIPARSKTSREIEDRRKRTRPHKNIKDFIQEGRV
jgi:prevent-host-death family protein